jgi:hypothetical protein
LGRLAVLTAVLVPLGLTGPIAIRGQTEGSLIQYWAAGLNSAGIAVCSGYARTPGLAVLLMAGTAVAASSDTSNAPCASDGRIQRHVGVDKTRWTM